MYVRAHVHYLAYRGGGVWETVLELTLGIVGGAWKLHVFEFGNAQHYLQLELINSF